MSAQPMTSMQRTLTTLGHREPDRVPFFLLTSVHGAKELGLSIREYFSRAKNVVEGQLRLHAKYRGDCLYALHSAAAEQHAWGGEIIYHDDGPPTGGEPYLRSFDAIDTLIPPHVDGSPGLLQVLEVIRGLKTRVGDTVPIVGVVLSPFSSPVMQLGFDRYFELMHEQPERFERLMRVNEAFAAAWANAQLAAGATAIGYFDPVSSTTITTRAQYLAMGQQVAKRTIAAIKGPTATHLASGRALAIVDDVAETGTGGLGVSSMEDLAELKAKAAGKLALLGNLDGISMRRWSADEAERQVKHAIAKAGRGGGFVLSDNHGEIPWQVPDDVLFALSEAVARWGRYPLDWIDGEAPQG